MKLRHTNIGYRIRRRISKFLSPPKPTKYPGTQAYWEDRYQQGGNSGSGSYGRLAEFKAEILNTLVREHAISSVIELGCGDGNQLSLANYPAYVGVDVAQHAVDNCRQKFADHPVFRFYSAFERSSFANKYDLALSLDVIFHLVEDQLYFAYLDDLFEFAQRMVVVYASNHSEPYDGSHMRYRKFTDDVSKRNPGWHLTRTIKNRYPYDPGLPNETSVSDFYVFEPKDKDPIR